jgi:hypothetical protein
MGQKFGAADRDGAGSTSPVMEGGEHAAFARRGDWDNPSGDEPSVPIIYDPR